MATASLMFSNGTAAYTISGAPITNGNSANVLLNTSAGLVTFSSSNSYGGGTIISGGTLVAGNNTALGTGAVSMNSPGVLDFTTTAPSIGGLSGSGVVVFGAGAKHQPYCHGRRRSLAAAFRRSQRAPAA